MIENLSKQIIDSGGNVQFLTIPSNETEGVGICNPSIYKRKNGEILLNLRNVQYSLYHSENEQRFQSMWGPLSYLHPEDDVSLRTTNFLCKLNTDTLEIENYSRIDTSELDVEPLWEFIGLEDGRLVEWDDKLYLIGVRRDTTTNGVGRMEYSEILDSKEISRIRIKTTGDDSSYCEKNWVPIIDQPHHFVKWTNPTEIIRTDVEQNKAVTCCLKHESVSVPRDIRGGSQVIPYKGYYIALTHEVDLFKSELGNKDAEYYHRFVVWDKEWNIISFSNEFKFFTANIEFSCGLMFHNNEIVATVGFQDTSAYLIRIPCDFFDKFVGIFEKTKTNNMPIINCVSYVDDVDRRSLFSNALGNYNLQSKIYITERDDDIKSKIEGDNIETVDKMGQYCLMSHLRSIKKWIDESNEQYGLFVEDDVSFDTIKYWPFSWDTIVSSLPKDFDIIQMCVVKKETDKSLFKLRKRYFDDWSVTAYLINRKFAKELIDRFVIDDYHFITNLSNKLQPIVENVIYSTDKAYVVPLFVETPNTKTTSVLRNTDSVDLNEKIKIQTYHNRSSKIQMMWWENDSYNFLNKTYNTDCLIKSIINKPYDSLSNFMLGDFYFKNGHYASALSYFLRSAEYGLNDDITYEALLMVAITLTRETRRPYSEKGAYMQAISFKPDRPEGYYFISLYFERNKDYMSAYTFASIGNYFINNSKNTLTDIGFLGKYSLLFQMAVNGYNIGKCNESRKIFRELMSKYEYLPQSYKTLVENNLKNIEKKQ